MKFAPTYTSITTNVNVTRRYQCLLNAVEGIEDFHVLRNSSECHGGKGQ